jgi:hypothetical protein
MDVAKREWVKCEPHGGFHRAIRLVPLQSPPAQRKAFNPIRTALQARIEKSAAPSGKHFSSLGSDNTDFYISYQIA